MKIALFLVAIGLVPLATGCAPKAPAAVAEKPFNTPEPYLLKHAPDMTKLTLVKKGTIDAIHGAPSQHGKIAVFSGKGHAYLRIKDWRVAKAGGIRIYLAQTPLNALRANHKLFDAKTTLRITNAALDKHAIGHGGKVAWFELPARFADAKSVVFYSKKDGLVYAGGNLLANKPAHKNGHDAKHRP